MEIFSLEPDGFGSVCYVLISGTSAAVVDPSVDARRICALSSSKGAEVKLILLTHGHFDHVGELDGLRRATGAPALIHADDAEMLTDGEKNAYSFFFGQNRSFREADGTFADGDTISVGEETLSVISTPGHSKGSSCFLGDGFIITGDTLFASGYGRYDLYGGDPHALRESLKRLATLELSLDIYPGHGAPAKLLNALKNIGF